MLKRTEAPALDPVALAELKRHCLVSTDEDLHTLASLLSAATEFVQDLTARQFLSAPYLFTADSFCNPIELRICPVVSIESLKYYDTDGVLQTLDPERYLLDAVSEPGRVTPAPGLCWPSTQRRVNAVQIEFTAGYGDRFGVPESAKQAIKLLVASWFNQREAVVVGSINSEIALAFTSLVYSLKWTA